MHARSQVPAAPARLVHALKAPSNHRLLSQWALNDPHLLDLLVDMLPASLLHKVNIRGQILPIPPQQAAIQIQIWLATSERSAIPHASCTT